MNFQESQYVEQQELEGPLHIDKHFVSSLELYDHSRLPNSAAPKVAQGARASPSQLIEAVKLQVAIPLAVLALQLDGELGADQEYSQI